MRIVWNASSTLEESNAEVSRKDRPCFSGEPHKNTVNTVAMVINFKGPILHHQARVLAATSRVAMFSDIKSGRVLLDV